MKYLELKDVQQDLNTLRYKGVQGGVEMGFKAWKDLFTIKKGYPVFIAGAPHEGKSELLFEILMQLSELHDQRHFIYSGESGTAAEIFAELCHKFIGKPYRKLKPDGTDNDFCMSDDERMDAEVWVSEHFFIIDIDHPRCTFKEFDVYEFYKNVRDVEIQLGFTFDTTSIDPYNDLDEDLKKYGGRQDLYLKDALKHVRQDAKINQRTNFIVNHISDIKPVTDTRTGKRYYPPALPNEWYGGKIWNRRGFLNILIYRQPSFLDETNRENVAMIEVQKAKPKGIGSLGTIELLWDWKKSRYYEQNITGGDMYSRKLNLQYNNPKTNELQSVKPNTDF